MNPAPLKTERLPEAPSLKKLIGPSFIILGLGLGSGEVILWPYLTSNYGMGIIWGALLGLTFQFIMNMEIERYALVHGESVFVGFARKVRWLPFWF
ncbi:Nramp family divalent metal transporter, partial [candidate division WWE3 bacterium]|nr:Nramp family divalent metal transporter [candidate division WWE3 bacterium]